MSSDDLPTHGTALLAFKSVQHASCSDLDIVSYTFRNRDQIHGDQAIFVDAEDVDNSLSFNKTYELTRQIVQGLKVLGVEQGDCVSIHAFNTIAYPPLFLGTMAAGGIVSGVNPGSTVPELTRHFAMTFPKVIFAQSTCIDAVRAAADECNIPRANIIMLGEEGFEWRAFLKNGTKLRNGSSFFKASPESTAVYSTTSGTTGPPKIAKISHRAIVAQIAAIDVSFKEKDYAPSQLLCIPVFHAFAAPLGLILPLVKAIPTYFLPRFELRSFINAVEKFEITDVAVVPPIIADLIHQEEITQFPHSQLQSLRYVICAGADLPYMAQSRLYAWLSPEAVVAQCYGTTECGWITLFGPTEKDTSGSVGRLMPNVELLTVTPDGRYFEDKIQGEASIRTPTMFSGYLYDSEAYIQSFDKNSFYPTGDIIEITHGKVYIKGRLKDVMKVNGFQVSPAEVEEALKLHPYIDDAAVCGVTTFVKGVPKTMIHGYVVRSDEAADTEQIMSFLAFHVSKYKLPTGGLHFVTEIPRTATGKVVRNKLAQVVIG